MAENIPRRAIVLTVDGWGAGYLGPYGNTWLETLACNQLASDGMLMEHVLVDSPSLDAFYQAVWAGGHAAFRSHASDISLPTAMAKQHYSSCLVTDSDALANHALTQDFAWAERVATLRQQEQSDLPENTRLAKLMAAALANLDHQPADLIWIHADTMRSIWDAPQEFREQFRDEDDPAPPTGVTPPFGPVALDFDSDHIQGWIWAYAAQVALLDGGLEALLESWQLIDEPALLIVMGTRGYGLAEHGCWGKPLGALHSEHLQVPLIVTSNAVDLANVRCQHLVQPYHVFQTLLDWFDLNHPHRDEDASLLTLRSNDLEVDAPKWPNLAVARFGDQVALRTPTWHACIPANQTSLDASGADTRCQLYLKPDDRWEVNNVADRCEDVVRQFCELNNRLIQMPNDARVDDLLPLHPLLLARPE